MILPITFFSIVVFAICNTIALMAMGDSYSQLYTLGHVCTIELIAFIMCDYKINKKLSYAVIFVCVLFLFHFGQLMLFTYFQNIYPHIRFLLLLDDKEAVYGFKMMNIAFSAICIGTLVKENSMKEYENHTHRMWNNNVNWERVAKNILYATFFVKLALDLSTLFITITAGGVVARAWVNSFPNILLYYGKISLVGFAILIMVNKYNPSRQKNIFLFIEAYILTMMMSGIRSENVGYLVVFLFIYLASRSEPIKLKNILVYGIGGFFALTFVVAVGQFRTASSRSLQSFFEIFQSAYSEENVILGLFDTCGDTGYTAQAVINNWLPHHAPSWGDAYYKGWTSIIPNLVPSVVDFGAITTDSSFPIKLQKYGALSHSYENIGGSVIGEIFFNFGILGGVIAAFILGWFIGWVSKKSTLYFKTQNYYGMILLFPIMFASIYWVRDYFGGGFREAVWGPLLCYYIVKHTKRISI